MSGIQYSDTPTHKAVSLTTHDQEYPLALPEGVKALRFRCRDGTALRYAFNTAGKAAGSTDPYVTLPANGEFFQEHLLLNGSTKVYFACGSDTKVVEATYWQ